MGASGVLRTAALQVAALAPWHLALCNTYTTVCSATDLTQINADGFC